MARVTKLNNGLRIVTEEMHHVSSVSMGVFVGVGSRDEGAGQYGVSHFLEHLAFKGTKDLSSKDLAIMVDSFGGEMNAFTTKEMTSFHLRLLGEAVGLGVDILGRILTEPAFYQSDIDSERSVILEEIAMANDEPSDFVHEQLSVSLFDGHPLGREVLGSRQSINSMSRETISDFFLTRYGPNTMVVAAAGALSHDELVEGFNSSIGSLPQVEAPSRDKPQVLFGNPVINFRDIEQVHVALAYPGIPKGDSRRWAFAILDQIYGGGLSSRLFQTVREEHGLCYSIYSDQVSYEDSGYLGIYFATSPRQLGRALELVDSVGGDLVAGGVSDQELAVAKRYLRAQILLSKEDTSSVMSRLGSTLIAEQELRSTDEILAEVDRVTAEDVMELAQEILAKSRQLSAVGPVPNGVLN